MRWCFWCECYSLESEMVFVPHSPPEWSWIHKACNEESIQFVEDAFDSVMESRETRLSERSER